jgi:hypothetical protein
MNFLSFDFETDVNEAAIPSDCCELVTEPFLKKDVELGLKGPL